SSVRILYFLRSLMRSDHSDRGISFISLGRARFGSNGSRLKSRGTSPMPLRSPSTRGKNSLSLSVEWSITNGRLRAISLLRVLVKQLAERLYGRVRRALVGERSFVASLRVRDDHPRERPTLAADGRWPDVATIRVRRRVRAGRGEAARPLV